MTDTALCLAEMATQVLTTEDGRAKTALSRQYAAQWFAARKGEVPAIPIGTAQPPLHPARPSKPTLLDPREVPKRKPGSEAGRKALLHAVAHIELNAVDLHWDIVARFSEPLANGVDLLRLRNSGEFDYFTSRVSGNFAYQPNQKVR